MCGSKLTQPDPIATPTKKLSLILSREETYQKLDLLTFASPNKVLYKAHKLMTFTEMSHS